MTEEKKIPVSGPDEDSTRVDEEEAATESSEPPETESSAPGNSDEQELNITDVDMAGDQDVKDPVEQIEELDKKLKETHDRLLRTAAELDNVRKRARRDVEEAKLQGRADVLREMLPAIDSLDLALKTADPEGKAAGIVEGVKMVRKQFLNAAERFGLKPIEALAKPFDPNFHEAMAQINSDKIESGNVVEEMRKGYLLGDRLLRASMVIVSKGPFEVQEASMPEKGSEADETDIPLTEDNDVNNDSGADLGEQEVDGSSGGAGERAPEQEQTESLEVGAEQQAEREEEHE